jgi:hypothetical protein
MAVRRRAKQRLRPDPAIRPRAVLDNDRCPEALADAVRNRPSYRVRPAAGHLRNDEAHRLRRGPLLSNRHR